MDKKQQTIETYNRTAHQMTTKFNAIGARVEDIEEVFALINKENPFVLEIGCANGRDASEIVKRTKNYLGIDISDKFIEIAKKHISQGRFEVADIESYEFPENLDAVFAFASLIHIPKESFTKVLKKIYRSLNTGGVVRLSMKHSDSYREVVKEDEFGTRTYYFYAKSDIEEMCKDFHFVRNDLNHLRGQDWLEIVLIKK